MGQVRFDIQDRRSVHQIRTPDTEHIAVLRMVFDGFQTHAGQPDGIRPEWGTSGKNAHPCISAKTRRSHGRRPFLHHRFGKFPDQPDMRIFLQPAQRLGIPVFRFKNDQRFQFLHQPALARNPELFRKIIPDTRNPVKRREQILFLFAVSCFRFLSFLHLSFLLLFLFASLRFFFHHFPLFLFSRKSGQSLPFIILPVSPVSSSILPPDSTTNA